MTKRFGKWTDVTVLPLAKHSYPMLGHAVGQWLGLQILTSSIAIKPWTLKL
jgi:hypothetical protein